VSVDREHLLEGLRDLVSATGERDCVRRIEAQTQRLFPSLDVRIRPTAHAGEPGPSRVVLRARGRVLGMLEFEGGHDRPRPHALRAFAEHAAIALDDARLLDEHERRARRDSLTGLRNHSEFRETLAAAVCSGRRRPH
jgi:predicted signal transduction protein with EAL and GGDEF domain